MTQAPLLPAVVWACGGESALWQGPHSLRVRHRSPGVFAISTPRDRAACSLPQQEKTHVVYELKIAMSPRGHGVMEAT